MKAAEDAHYVLSATTAGTSDTQTNECGITMSHAYSVLAAFTMTDSGGTAHKCLLVRNPWGRSTYSGKWNKNDGDWTDALIAQVPYNHDPRTEQDSNGIFVTPISNFVNAKCFDGYQIGHMRNS